MFITEPTLVHPKLDVCFLQCSKRRSQITDVISKSIWVGALRGGKRNNFPGDPQRCIFDEKILQCQWNYCGHISKLWLCVSCINKGFTPVAMEVHLRLTANTSEYVRSKVMNLIFWFGRSVGLISNSVLDLVVYVLLSNVQTGWKLPHSIEFIQCALANGSPPSIVPLDSFHTSPIRIWWSAPVKFSHVKFN